VLYGLNGCVHGVGHVRVYGIGARSVPAGSGAARQSFVIGEILALRVFAAHGQIIHGSLRGRACWQTGDFRQSGQNHIDDPLAGFDVARGNGSGITHEWSAR